MGDDMEFSTVKKTPMILNEILPTQNHLNNVQSVEVIGAEADPRRVNSPSKRLIKTNACTPVNKTKKSTEKTLT